MTVWTTVWWYRSFSCAQTLPPTNRRQHNHAESRLVAELLMPTRDRPNQSGPPEAHRTSPF